MKNLFLLFTFLVISSITGLAQNYSSDSPVTRSGSVPSTCTAGDAPTVYGADIYICVAGTRYTVSTTAAGGSISGLTATRVPVAASGTTLTNYAGFTHDGTTLTVAALKDTGLTSGRVPFATTGGLLTDDALFLWDSTNHYLGIGAAAGRRLTVTDGSGNEQIRVAYDGTKYLNISADSSGNLRISGIGTDAFWGYNRYYLNSGTTGTTQLYGTSNGSGGGSILLYMGSHASLPDSVVVKAGGTVALTAYQNGHVTISASSTDLTSQLGIVPASTTTIGQIIKLATSQSADALQVQDSTGATLTRITSGGNLIFGAAASSSYPMLLNNGTARLGVKYADATGYAEIESAPIRIYSTGTTSPIIDIARYSAFITSVSNGGYRWESTSSITGAADTGLSRIAAGVVGIGTGAAGSVAGSMSMTNLTLAGVANAAAGSVSTPSLNFTDAATGFYRTGTNTIGITINGVNSLRFDPNNGILFRSDYFIAWASNTSYSAPDVTLLRPSAGLLQIGNNAGGNGDLQLRNLTASGNFFAGPSTIESFTTNASALGTLNYYTDSQTIYYDTAAATADVTINVDASASVDLNTRLATGQMVTVVLAITNTGTPYKCNTLQVHSVGQTIKWVGGSAPTGVANGVDWYTFTIMKTGSSTYYITGSMTSYK